MNKEAENIFRMVKEIAARGVEKQNHYVSKRSDLLLGMRHAYYCVLSILYNQAISFEIPINYVGLDCMDEPDKVFLSMKGANYYNNTLIPKINQKYQSKILNWISDSKLLIKEKYEDCLQDKNKDEFYNSIVNGFEEIFTITEKYGIIIV